VGVSYYRTDRVPNENVPGIIFVPGIPGVQQSNSDYVLAGGRGLSAPFNFTVSESTNKRTRPFAGFSFL
jgi:hypothetical protein